jgi:hypothetical protein
MLPAGDYTIRFSASGYTTTKVVAITVHAGDTLAIDQALTPGPEASEVVVQWDATAVPGTTTTTNKEVPAVKAIPLASRNYTQAAGLVSGVSSQVSNATAIGINTQGVQVGSGNTSNYMMDGASIAATTGGVDSPGIPNPDAIAENSVQSWSYAAGPERYSGANIGVVTKSGTDILHGTLFEFVRNDIFNANDFFIKRAGFPEPVLKQNQFGFTLGGPVWKKKVFFFTSYQGTRQRNGFAMSGFASQVTLAPLPATRTAAAVGAALCPANHPGDSRYQTLFGVQVACDGSNINQVALNLLNLKLANGSYLIPGSSNLDFQQVPYSIPATFQEDQIILNTDFALSEKEKVVERFFYARDPQTANFTGGSNSLPGTPSTILTGNIYGVVRLATTISASLSNEIRVSGQHDLLNDTPHVPFTNGDTGIASVVSGIDMLDGINVGGLFSIGGNGSWDHNSVNQYQAADQINWTHSRQAMRMGFEVDRRQWNIRVLGDARGSLTFLRFADFLLGLPGCPPAATGCSVSNPVVNGVVTNGSPFSNVFGSSGPGGSTADVTSAGGINHEYRFADASGYFQDDIRLFPNLTVNAGVRWDYFGLPADSTSNSTSFWPSLAGAWTAPPAGGTYQGFVVPSNFSGLLPGGATRNTRRTPLPIGSPRANFAPRLGFSWQARENGSLVVRGGYGMFYDRPDASMMDAQTMSEVPYAVPVGGVGAANSEASLAQPFVNTAFGWGPARLVNLATGANSLLSLSILDENFSTPQTHKWSLEIQAQLPLGFTAAAGYAGAHSIHLQDTMRQINEPRLASAASPINGIAVNTIANAPLRVPYLGIAPAGMSDEQTQGRANYNGLQVTLMKMTHNGLHVQAAYKFSKTLSDLGAAPPPPGAPMTGGFNSMDSNDPLDARQQYGPMMMAAPQRLAVNYGWNFSWKGSGIRGMVLTGWGLSGMTIIQSGTPVTISDSSAGTIYGNAGLSRAQLCPGMRMSDVPTTGGVKDRLNAYFNKAALADTDVSSGSASCQFPAIGDGTGYGNTSVGFLLTPGQDNTDFSISKSIGIRESKVEFRAEFFNTFNHPQFMFPDPNVPDTTFGQITSTSVNPRLIQFAAKYSF